MKKAWIAYVALFLAFILLLVLFILQHDKRNLIAYPVPEDPVPESNFMLDINTATADQLQEVPGIGPVLAKSIVDYREENGPFKEYSDLLNVKGIGQSKLIDIMDYIRIK